MRPYLHFLKPGEKEKEDKRKGEEETENEKGKRERKKEARDIGMYTYNALRKWRKSTVHIFEDLHFVFSCRAWALHTAAGLLCSLPQLCYWL